MESKPRARSLLTYAGKVVARRGGENWRGGTAVKPGSLCLGEFKHSGNWGWIHPVGKWPLDCGGKGGAAAPCLGKQLCAVL